MKHLKKLLSLLFVGVLLTALPFQSKAASEEYSNIAEYDLSSGKAKTFVLEDSYGEMYYCTIKPLTDNSVKIKSGNYKVSYTVPNKWKASFVVTIASNKIKALSSPYTHAIVGSIANSSLVKESSTKGALTFRYLYSGFKLFTGVRCYLSNNTLKTEKL